MKQYSIVRPAAKPRGTITFECDLKGCSNTKTTYKHLYKKSENHFCSIECAKKGKSKGMVKKDNTRAKLISKQIEEYFALRTN